MLSKRLLKGPVELITGNFTYFTKIEAKAIQASLTRGQTLVLVHDRDSITTPANERAAWIRRYFDDHPQLEVRVAYGAPPDIQEKHTSFGEYFAKRIPKGITISAVACNNGYSAHLASHFLVPHKPIAELSQLKEIETAIKLDTTAAQSLLSAVSAPRVTNSFKNIIPEASFVKEINRQKKGLAEKIVKRNPYHPNHDLFFKRTPWNTNDLNRVNRPIIVGEVHTAKQRAAFSDPMQYQVFDMLLYVPGEGWKIPAEFAPLTPILAKIVAAESLANPDIERCYAYLTRDWSHVFPDMYARREGLHVDGFLTQANASQDYRGIIWGDHTYIISDAQDLQTELYSGPFDLYGVNLNNARAVMQAFEDQGSKQGYSQARPYQIIRLTTNNVHAVHPNLTNNIIARAFMKVTFSNRLFNRSGNTVNSHINKRILIVPRTEGRNTQNFIGELPPGYEHVNLHDLQFASRKFPHWVEHNSIKVCKNPNVRITATPAIEGEKIDTIVNGHIVTSNVARPGDTKVTRADGDSYFLGNNFSTLYKKVRGNVYAPRADRTLNAVKVTENVCFEAPWGTQQKIPRGGYIVESSDGEKWGVHEMSFNATYRNKV